MALNLGLLLLVIGGSIGVACSLLTLWILARMMRWNGYIKLILLLTVSQFVYDVSIVMVVFPGREVEFAYIALRSMSGLWATFVTNVLSFVVVYTVWTMQAINVSEHFRKIFFLVVIPAACYGVVVPVAYFSFSDLEFEIVSSVYYWIRVVSIVFNIGSYAVLVYKLNQLDKTPRVTSLKSSASDPLRALANRFKYYPIVQVLSRVGVAWYEELYGHGYTYDADESLSKRISFFLYVLTLPSAGLGFFLVFVMVSPGAIILHLTLCNI